MVKKIKRGQRAVAIMVTLVMLSSLTAAFAINYPIEVQQREIDLFLEDQREVDFFVQLGIGEGTGAEIKIEKGSEIISLIGPNSITVPANNPTKVSFNLRVPADARVGSTYPVEIVFKKTSASAGTLAIGGSIRAVFDVNIIERPREPSGASVTLIILLLAIAIIILALIIYFILRKRR